MKKSELVFNFYRFHNDACSNQIKETKGRSSGQTPFTIKNKMVTKTANPKKHLLTKTKFTFIPNNF